MSETKRAKPKRPPSAAAPQFEPVAPRLEPIAALPSATEVAALPVPAPRQMRASPLPPVWGDRELLNTMASDVEAIALEVSGLAQANLAAATDTVTALLAARSFGAVVEAEFGFARRCLDAVAGSATRLAELGLKLTGNACTPALRPLAVR